MEVEKKGFTGGIYTLLLDGYVARCFFGPITYLMGWCIFFFLPIFIFHFQ